MSGVQMGDETRRGSVGTIESSEEFIFFSTRRDWSQKGDLT